MHGLVVRHAIAKAYRIIDNSLNPMENISEEEKLAAISTLYPHQHDPFQPCYVTITGISELTCEK